MGRTKALNNLVESIMDKLDGNEIAFEDHKGTIHNGFNWSFLDKEKIEKELYSLLDDEVYSLWKELF